MDVAKMPARDYRVFGALLRRANYGDGDIPEQFQPRSLEKLTAACGLMGRTAVADGLNHLEQHGWVIRHRLPPGRGNATFYALDFGADCDCAPASERTAPTKGAERARQYRARKKASGIRVTDEEASRGIRVTKRPPVTHESAGQTLVPSERAREGGVVGEGTPKPEYTGGPVSWDADDVADWLEQTGGER